MNYIQLHPTDRDDLSTQILERIPEIMKYDCTFINSGTGSGKSRIMRQIPHMLENTITYVLCPDDMLKGQLYKVFQEDTGIQLFNGDSPCIISDIKDFSKTIPIVVFFSNIGHKEGNFKKLSSRLIQLFEIFSDYKPVVLIDELHKVLTSLTGGLNPTINHAETQLRVYMKLMVQQKKSLNMFDVFRRVGAKVFGFSATLNHVINSKLHTIGYVSSKICCVNVYPISTLYAKLKCIGVDTSDFDKIYPYMQEAEKIQKKKILIIFPSEESIYQWISNYRWKTGKSPAHVKITSKSPIPTTSQLKDAQYILGITMLSTGYDISTHIADQEFSLGILIREFSDKSSQPLSANPYHYLHMEESAQLLQALGRLRGGGIFLVPTVYDGINLYGLHMKIADRIRDGHMECMMFGEPVSNQVDRYHQANLVGLWQNIREEKERPVVEEILNDMKSIEGKTVMDVLLSGTFNVEYWISVMRVLWDTYILQEIDNVSIESFIRAAKNMCKTHYNTLHVSGGGLRTVRLTDDEVRVIVEQRSKGICAHCGDLIDNPAERQFSHIQRHDDGGPFMADNIVLTHRGCDGSFDDGSLLHDPDGGYWRLKRLCGYSPDMKQIECCGSIYIQARWTWVQQHKRVPEGIEFRKWLAAHNYQHIT